MSGDNFCNATFTTDTPETTLAHFNLSGIVSLLVYWQFLYLRVIFLYSILLRYFLAFTDINIYMYNVSKTQCHRTLGYIIAKYPLTLKNKKAQLTQREHATAVHVWRPTANKCKIRKNLYFSAQGHSRSLLSDFRCQSKPVYDFLLVINCNLGPISHRFRDTATFRFESLPPRAAQPFKVIQGHRSWS